MAHGRLSPSSRHRWALCPGSVREEVKYPERDSPAAADGTHSHTLLEHCLSEDIEPQATVGQTFSDDSGSFRVDAARAARVKVATDYVRNRTIDQQGMCEVLAETRVDPMRLLGRDDLGGTVDVQILGSELLEIVDYKDGMGIVEVKGNHQLEVYALGCLAASDRTWNRVRMTVIQPKLALKGMAQITSHEVSVQDLLNMKHIVAAQAAATDDPNAPLVPGESQCKFCRAKGSCSALAGSVMKEIGVMFQPVASPTLDIAQQAADKDPATMPDSQICQIIEAAPLMRQLLEGVEKEAFRRLKAGQVIPGLKLVNGRGSRAWMLPDDEMAGKLVKMGIPKGALYESSFVSPAKAEKLTWEKRDGTKVQLTDRQLQRMDQEYVAKLAGKLTVAPESDSRPAVVTDAASLFGAVTTAPAVDALPSWLTCK